MSRTLNRLVDRSNLRMARTRTKGFLPKQIEAFQVRAQGLAGSLSARHFDATGRTIDRQFAHVVVKGEEWQGGLTLASELLEAFT